MIIPNNEIWLDGSGIILIEDFNEYLEKYGGFGAEFVELVYQGGYYVLRFNGSPTKIPPFFCGGFISGNVFEFFIPDTVTEIGDFAFEYKGFRTLVIPDSIRKIGISAFAGCGRLTDLTLGTGLTEIGVLAFSGCGSLTNITARSLNPPKLKFGAFVDVGINGLLSFPSGSDYTSWLYIDNFLSLNKWKTNHYIEYPVYPTIESDVPNNEIWFDQGYLEFDFTNWNGPNYVDTYLSGDKKIAVFDGELTEMPHNFIKGIDCRILRLPSSVRYISGSFYRGHFLNELDIRGVEIIGPASTSSTELYPEFFNVILGDNIKYIGERFFTNSYLKQDLPEGLRGIGPSCFKESSISRSDNFIIPSTVEYIGDYAFDRCDFYCDNIDFRGCDYIGNGAFTIDPTYEQQWYEETLTLPEGLKYIGDWVFSGRTDITTVRLPSTLKYIGREAFAECSNLKTIYCTANPLPAISKDTFRGVGYYGRLYYIEGTENIRSWWNTNEFYLEYYAWNLVHLKFGKLNVSTNSVSVSDRYSMSSFDVTGVDINTYYTPKPDADWITIIDSQQLQDGGIRYFYEVNENDGYERQNKISVTALDNYDNKLNQEITVNQMESGIILGARKISFYVEGGSEVIEVTYNKPQTVNLPAPQATWIMVVAKQATVPDDDGSYTQRYEIRVPSTTVARESKVTFSCIGTNGSTYTMSLVVSQSTESGEVELKPKVSPYVERMTVLNDGTPEYSSYTTIGVGYANCSEISTPTVNADWFRITDYTTENGNGTFDTIRRYSYDCDANTGEERSCTITFAGVGDNTSVAQGECVITQLAGEQKELAVSPFVTKMNINSDGTPEYSSYTEIKVGYNGCAKYNTPTTDVDWITVGEPYEYDGKNSYDKVLIYPWTATANENDEQRIGVITFSGEDADGNVQSNTCTFTQAANSSGDEDNPELPPDSQDSTVAPIWQDTVYTFGTSTYVVYGIYVETTVIIPHYGPLIQDELIFKGKACASPVGGDVSILVNKICQNYFDENSFNFDSVGFSRNYRKFKLKDDNGVLLHTYHFVNDWSYEPLFAGVKTNPIIPNIVDGQKLFFSVFSWGELPIEWGMDYNDGTPQYNNTEKVSGSLKTVVVTPSREKNVDVFRFDGNSYKAIPKCKCQMMLYYANPYGGWDWFPIMGKVTRNDSITQYTYTKNYNNNTTEFAKSRYLSEVAINYTLNTGYLTGKQSARMWELLESNSVYLHNLETNTIDPVIITNTEIEHKKRGIVSSRISYDINVQFSHSRERL